MPLRTLVFVALILLVIASLYACTVRRGRWGWRKELPLEVAAAGHAPWKIHIYDEQRLPEYSPAVQWLAPALSWVHAIDIIVRRGYWHEQEFPDFSDAPEFDLSK
jgi:hypothetical protein